MRRLIGLTFLALGVIAGIVLLLAPFGRSPLAAGPLMWFTFPFGCVIGHVFLMIGASREQMAVTSLLVGAILLLLGLSATVAQFLVSGGVWPATGDTLSLWYVASGGIVLGGIAYALRGNGKAARPPDVPG
jgi:LPXTG-motif cell wall-anchored protein